MFGTCNYIDDYGNTLIESSILGDYFGDGLCREVAVFPIRGYSGIEERTDSSDECATIPLTDIFENDNEFIIRSEMPGVARDGIQVTLDNNMLDIKGKINESFSETDKIRYSEFDMFDYHRRVMLDSYINIIDEKGLSANLENGILTVKLPKKEAAKPRKIEVKSIN